MIFTIFANIHNKIQYFYDYNILLFENDLNHKKFTSTFKNQIIPSIQINKNTYCFEYNTMFIDFFKKFVNNLEDYNGFFETSKEEMENFNNVTKLTSEYINLYRQIEKSKFFDIESLTLDKLGIKLEDMHIFFKKLFYLYKIFNKLRINYRNEENGNSQNNAFDIIFLDKNKFLESDKFKTIGNYHAKDLSFDKFTTFDILFKNLNINNLEMIIILFYDTTNIAQIEKEKAEVENKFKARHDYLSLMSDKFFTPVQVLILTAKDMSKEFENLKIKKPEKLLQIENLGRFISCLNRDITCFATPQSGIDIQFEKFNTSKLFTYCQQIIDYFIIYNSTKCHAIRTELLIHPDVPNITNSDINRLEQVILNFLNNAYRFTLSGTIQILVSLEDSNELYDEIKVCVKDTGIGVNKLERESLFTEEKDLETKKGMGLILNSRIVSRIGLQIGYSPIEHGSKFHFTFLNIKNKEMENIITNNKSIKMNAVVELMKFKKFNIS